MPVLGYLLFSESLFFSFFLMPKLQLLPELVIILNYKNELSPSLWEEKIRPHKENFFLLAQDYSFGKICKKKPTQIKQQIL